MAHQQGMLAVSVSELEQWGCTNCGYRSGFTPISGGGTAVWTCGECGTTTVVLAEGLTQSTIGSGYEKEDSVYPNLTNHPRRGIPAHDKPDIQPDGGGEYFRSRGIGTDRTPGCFVCGGPDWAYHNIAGFVETKAAGERVVAMFSQGARLDYREREPNWIQVKIGACDQHLEALEHLHKLTQDANNVLTAEMIATTQK